jgi:hypothetical protein
MAPLCRVPGVRNSEAPIVPQKELHPPDIGLSQPWPCLADNLILVPQ